jgi:hypothetical protein
MNGSCQDHGLRALYSLFIIFEPIKGMLESIQLRVEDYPSRFDGSRIFAGKLLVELIDRNRSTTIRPFHALVSCAFLVY